MLMRTWTTRLAAVVTFPLSWFAQARYFQRCGGLMTTNRVDLKMLKFEGAPSNYKPGFDVLPRLDPRAVPAAATGANAGDGAGAGAGAGARAVGDAEEVPEQEVPEQQVDPDDPNLGDDIDLVMELAADCDEAEFVVDSDTDDDDHCEEVALEEVLAETGSSGVVAADDVHMRRLGNRRMAYKFAVVGWRLGKIVKAGTRDTDCPAFGRMGPPRASDVRIKVHFDRDDLFGKGIEPLLDVDRLKSTYLRRPVDEADAAAAGSWCVLQLDS